MNKHYYCIILFTALAISVPALAKRVHVDYSDEVTVKNIKYRATYTEGFWFHKAYIEAIDLKTKCIKRRAKVYSTFMNPFIEHDVQWILIKEIVFKNGSIIIKNEKEALYSLDIDTFKATKIT